MTKTILTEEDMQTILDDTDEQPAKTDTRPSLGQILRKIRTERNLSCQNMAKTIGICSETYSNYENDQNVPSATVVNRIADAYNLDINELMECIRRTESGKTASGHTTEFGKALRKARLSTGMTQFELALKTGISTTNIGKYERGTTTPPIDKIRKIAKACQVSEDDLCRYIRRKTERKSELLENFEALSPEGQKKLLEYMQDLRAIGKYNVK